MRNPMHVGVIDFQDDDEEQPILCPFCEKLDYKVGLGPKGILEGEQPTPDQDQFLQCYQCGAIIPIYQAKYEQTLEGFTEPNDNPFDSGKEVLGIPKPTSPAGRKASAQRKRERQRSHHPDKEVDNEIRTHGEDRVKIAFRSIDR
jgi:hypothetical protein